MALTKPTGNASVYGTASDDYVVGTPADEIISGGVQAIAYTAGDGNDTMEGGLGDDQYIVNDLADVIYEYAGEGTDTVFSSVDYTLPSEVENIGAAKAGDVPGTAIGVKLTGNSKDNILDGSSSDTTGPITTAVDTLIGMGGNDSYILGTGDKIIEGIGTVNGATYSDAGGIDTIVSATTVDISKLIGVAEQKVGGSDAIKGQAFIENVTLINAANANITGNTLNNRLTGNSGNNAINGNNGNDILDTGAGGTADALDGGAGNDTYIIRSGVTGTSISDVSGNDTVKSFATVDASSWSSIENVTLLGLASTNITGNALNNVLIGNAEVNTLLGNAGNDTLNGGGANDSLNGGNGNDVYIADVGDTVTESTGGSTGGADSVQLGGAAGTFTLASNNVESITLMGSAAINATASGTTTGITMTGNSGNNSLAGGSGNDVLSGGLGADILVGGLGNDIYIADVDDTVTETTGGSSGGSDSVQLGGVAGTFTLTSSNVESITLTGTADIKATASGTTTSITMNGNSGLNSLTGGGGSDVLLGNAGNDTLTGNSGDDTLNGGIGDDSMVGGAGRDTYIVDSASDVISETTVSASASQLDSVQAGFASGTFTLSANVENITLAGTTNISATGNASNNVMIGNIGNNTLDGTAGNGNDTLTGLAGADTIKGGSGNDIITGGIGRDSVTSGTGNDKIVFAAGVADTVATATSIAGVDLYSDLDLNADSSDLIDLTVAVATVGATVTPTTLAENTFVTNMNTALNISGSGFDTSITGDIAAAIVTGGTGSGLVGRSFLAVDLDHSNTFTATDFVIEITGSTVTSLTIDSFI